MAVAARSSSTSACSRFALRSTMATCSFSHTVGMAQLNLHFIQVSLHLLLQPQGFIPAPDLSIQSALHGLHNSEMPVVVVMYLSFLQSSLDFRFLLLNLLLDFLQLMNCLSLLSNLLCEGGTFGIDSLNMFLCILQTLGQLLPGRREMESHSSPIICHSASHVLGLLELLRALNRVCLVFGSPLGHFTVGLGQGSLQLPLGLLLLLILFPEQVTVVASRLQGTSSLSIEVIDHALVLFFLGLNLTQLVFQCAAHLLQLLLHTLQVVDLLPQLSCAVRVLLAQGGSRGFVLQRGLFQVIQGLLMGLLEGFLLFCQLGDGLIQSCHLLSQLHSYNSNDGKAVHLTPCQSALEKDFLQTLALNSTALQQEFMLDQQQAISHDIHLLNFGFQLDFGFDELVTPFLSISQAICFLLQVLHRSIHIGWCYMGLSSHNSNGECHHAVTAQLVQHQLVLHGTWQIPPLVTTLLFDTQEKSFCCSSFPPLGLPYQHEHVVVEELLQFLIGEVDAQLLKAVELPKARKGAQVCKRLENPISLDQFQSSPIIRHSASHVLGLLELLRALNRVCLVFGSPLGHFTVGLGHGSLQLCLGLLLLLILFPEQVTVVASRLQGVGQGVLG
ncbi:hypothetical protein IHE44_0006733, partial [Lamprotornis superbus]